MRARVLAAGLALLLLALPALALPAAAEPVQRLRVTVPHPLPGSYVAVWEDPDCTTHALLWQGAWFTAIDAANWALTGSGDGDLAERPRAWAARLLGLAADATADAAAQAPGWATDPLGPAMWGVALLDREDVCLLTMVEVRTNLPGPV